MFSGQTTIRRVVARCPARTEPLVARVRLGRLLQGADLAPPGLPPQAVLVIRRVEARRNVSLASSRLRPEWEREAREEVARNWRRAVRPARGRVPPDAAAVWFEDVSEWLAALGLAVRRREVEHHWCWRASLGAGVPTSSADTLARAWSQSPRFLPAAVVRLARWGEAAPVLALLGPAEADALLSALAAEFDLPHAAHARAFDAPRDPPALHTGTTSRDTGAAHSSVDGGAASNDGLGTTADARDTRPAPAPPWRRWLPSADAACERMAAPAQRLLSFAAALFHSPAHARTRRFAAEVTAYVEHAHRPRAARDVPSNAPRLARDVRTREGAAARGTGAGRRDPDEPSAATRDATNTTRRAREDASPAGDGEPLGEASATTTTRAARPAAHGAHAEASPVSSPFIDDDAEAPAEELAARGDAWRDLEGHETALGGLLFLLNFFIHLRLPECFDEDFRLSEHVTGWGLAEAVGRALLAELGGAETYDQDPLWGVLARLDGRGAGEPPAAGLRVGGDYRTPARWLRHFVADDAASLSFRSDGRRLALRHAGGFTVAVETLAGRAPSRVAARLIEDYRAQGHALEGADEALAKLDARHRGGTSVDEQRLDEMSVDERSLDEASCEDGRPDDEQTGLGRWLSWTLPFMRYVLARALAEGEEALTGEELARALLLRRGRVYATATHVDLLMRLGEVSLPVRRAGLDASPGWVRDLVRVVAFHYE